MSFKLRNPDNADAIVETTSEDRRDFLMGRGWTLVAGEAPASASPFPFTANGIADDHWFQEAVARGAVAGPDDVLQLPDIHLEEEIDEIEADQHDSDMRKGRR